MSVGRTGPAGATTRSGVSALGAGMAKFRRVRGGRRRLVREIDGLIESAEQLRKLLQEYKKVSARLARLVEAGEPVVDAIERIGSTTMRPAVTDAIDALEAARHRTRLALFDLSAEEGSSISEMSRALRISRQLGSRIAKELETRPR
jgi:hypothetical protein